MTDTLELVDLEQLIVDEPACEAAHGDTTCSITVIGRHTRCDHKQVNICQVIYDFNSAAEYQRCPICSTVMDEPMYAVHWRFRPI